MNVTYASSMDSSAISREGSVRDSARSIDSLDCLRRSGSNTGGDIDGPDCADDARCRIDRWPVGEACRLRGVGSLRWRGGDLEAAMRLRALPIDEALGNEGSIAAGYLAYC